MTTVNTLTIGKGNTNQMKKYFVLLMISVLLAACGTKSKSDEAAPEATGTAAGTVTFIELGSDNCIPCKQMQPVLESIRTRYGSRVNVIFYDVWKPEYKAMSQKYKIRVIPTQIFIDADGTEYYRHEGFFPETDIDHILSVEGIYPLNGK